MQAHIENYYENSDVPNTSLVLLANYVIFVWTNQIAED